MSPPQDKGMNRQPLGTLRGPGRSCQAVQSPLLDVIPHGPYRRLGLDQSAAERRMARSEPGLEERIFGGRWAVAERSPKPAWVQIEEQLGDRIESGALAPGARLPPE